MEGSKEEEGLQGRRCGQPELGPMAKNMERRSSTEPVFVGRDSRANEYSGVWPLEMKKSEGVLD